MLKCNVVKMYNTYTHTHTHTHKIDVKIVLYENMSFLIHWCKW